MYLKKSFLNTGKTSFVKFGPWIYSYASYLKIKCKGGVFVKHRWFFDEYLMSISNTNSINSMINYLCICLREEFNKRYILAGTSCRKIQQDHFSWSHLMHKLHRLIQPNLIWGNLNIVFFCGGWDCVIYQRFSSCNRYKIPLCLSNPVLLLIRYNSWTIFTMNQVQLKAGCSLGFGEGCTLLKYQLSWVYLSAFFSGAISLRSKETNLPLSLASSYFT